MRKKHTFLESINRAREAASARPQSSEKPLGELSEQELDVAMQRAQAELRAARERELAAAREVAAETGRNQSKFLFAGKRRNRRPWK